MLEKVLEKLEGLKMLEGRERGSRHARAQHTPEETKQGKGWRLF